MDIYDPLLHADGADPLYGDLTAEATLWVVRLTSGETTAEERQAFRLWRDQSPAHAAALADARRVWLSLGPALEPARRKRRALLRADHWPRFGAIAASLIACLVIGGQCLQTYGHDYVTGPGERRSLTLADGTKVLLNGRSALDVRFQKGARKVALARGAAYFDVVHDPTQPFTVAAGDGEVRDIGTAFSVTRSGRGAAVVVARGAVEVVPAMSGATAAKLAPNQTVAYDGAGPAVVRATDAAKDLSWVRGRLILENRSLSDSVSEINRYYSGRLVLLDGDAGAARINAVIDLNRIDDWLAALDKSHAAKVVRVGSLVLLY